MPIPASGAISMQTIRNEYWGQSVWTTNYSISDSDLMNLNYYRGKHYYRTSDGLLGVFSSGAITMNDFRGTQAANPFPPPPPPPPSP